MQILRRNLTKDATWWALGLFTLLFGVLFVRAWLEGDIHGMRLSAAVYMTWIGLILFSRAARRPSNTSPE